MLVVAAAALLDTNGRVLVQQRRPGDRLAGMWEFPGGKLETGEAATAGLARELREELAIGVAPSDLNPFTFWSGEADGRELLLLLFTCKCWTGEPRPHAAAALAWHEPSDLRALPMPVPDMPLVDALARRLQRGGE